MEQKTTNGLGIASLVLGIIALLFSCCYGGAIGVIGLVLGLIALSKKNLAKGCAIGGVVTSIISILITLIVVILGISFLSQLYEYSNNNLISKVITSENPNSTIDADNKSGNSEISDDKTNDTKNTIIPFATESVSGNSSLKVNQIKLNKSTVYMSTAEEITLKVLNTNKSIKWSSSNKNVVRVSKKGTITPVWIGEATVSAKIGNKKLKCKVYVLCEDFWGMDYKETQKESINSYSLSVMNISKNKTRIKICTQTSNKTICSGNVYGKLKNNKIIFKNAGKYHLTGEIQFFNYSDEQMCMITVKKADKKAFIVASLVFDYKTENS